MDKVILKKSRDPKKNELPQERIQPDEGLNTISVPKRDMIMPREFNSVSDPKLRNPSHSQTTNMFSLGGDF